MKIVLFYHSLRSDWNHGNAHFLRGVVTELLDRGHEVAVFEPSDSWSLQNLIAEYGREPLARFEAAYPGLSSISYDLGQLRLDQELENADLVIVHEWNSPALIQQIGAHRQRGGNYRLLFHDTHHRMVSAPRGMINLSLEHYDGVLAYGQVLQRLYEKTGCVNRVWTWHEAADTRVFRPLPDAEVEGDVVWVGNWGDDERSSELQEFLIQPIKHLRARARVYGVRYPEIARQALADANISYAGWLPNFEVPRVFGGFRATIHVPRRPYVQALPGIPTIRPFEALACGIPLVSSPWDDCEHLFTPGRDFLIARDGRDMERQLNAVLNDESLARELIANGLKTIRSRHTCAHRVDELLSIEAELRGRRRHPASAAEYALSSQTVESALANTGGAASIPTS
jgi:spore maturation protein CgeB